MYPFFKIDKQVEEAGEKAVIDCSQSFKRVEEISEYNAAKVLAAFIENRVGESHLKGTTGYGYGDRGRDTLDAVFAKIFGAEDALVRHSFASGTSTIATALFGVLRPGDKIVSISGRPYDTLHSVLGIRGENVGSLKEFGVIYDELALTKEGRVDKDKLCEKIKDAKVAYLQRSRGYSLRPSIFVDEIKTLVEMVKKVNKNCIFVVDNCYGEFVEKFEPTDVGADLIIGSLIKNPGGGIARSGGYIAGKREYIELCANRMTAPGVGREVGCSLDENKNLYLGLFLAPSVTAAALKTAIFASCVFKNLGYKVLPNMYEERTDIIQTVVLETKQKLISFCRGIQRGSPIDSFVTPEGWEMPGYESEVIMAAGAFHMGASIELSADGPMREPYAAWLQGGLTFESGKIGILLAAQELLNCTEGQR